MSELIERMARAAYEAQRARFNPTVTEGPEYELQPWEDEPEALRSDWRQFMRDGLVEAREPTERMLEAARKAPLPPGEPDSLSARWDLVNRAHWKAMIDAELGSDSKPT